MKKTLLFFAQLAIVLSISGQFNPASIPGLKAWYAADSAILNGVLVSALIDKTGGTNNAVQVTAAKQPTFVANRLNGKPVVQFNGTATKFYGFRTTANVDLSATNQLTIFVVHQTRAFSNTITQTIYEHSDNLTNSDAFDYDVSASAPDKEVIFTNGAAGFSGCQTNIPRDTQFVISCQIIDKTLPGANENVIYFNGLKVSAANFVNNNTDGFKSYQLNIGARGNATAAPYIGCIAEMLVYGTGLDSSSRRQVESYLRLKYAKQINLGPDTVIKYGFCPYNLNIGSGFSNILWSNGATTVSTTVTKSGTYWVRAKDAFGYITTDTIKITYPSAKLNYRDTTLCAGGSYTLQTQLTGTPYNYLWKNNQTTASVPITVADKYFVTITDSSGCSVNSDTANILLDNFASTRLFGNDTSICKYAGLSPFPSVIPLASSFAWSTGGTTPSITLLTGGNIYLTVTSTAGCKSIDTIVVTLTGNAPSTSFIRDTACSGEAIHFTSQSTSNGDAISKTRWLFGNGDSALTANATYTYPKAGTYTVTLTNFTQTGCQSAAAQQVIVSQGPTLNFIADTTCLNNNYIFQNLTSTAAGDSVLNYNWNLSNTTSTLFSPSYSYSSTGVFPISLSITTVKGCKESLSKNLSVLTSAPTPGSFNLLLPVNAAILPAGAIAFQWAGSSNAVSYTLQVSKDSLFGTFIANKGVRSLSALASPFTGGTYYWRIIARGYCGDTLTSTKFSFAVPDPGSIAGLKAWYAADSATLNGNLVSALLDKTGGSNNAVQATAAKQPTFIANRLNGKPVVQFNGTATKFFGFRTASDVDLSATNQLTIFVVHQTKAFSNTITQTIYEHSDNLTNSDAFDYDVSGSAPDKEVIFTNGAAGFSGCQTNIPRDTQFVISCQIIDKTLPGANENVIYFNGQKVSAANFVNNNTDGFKSYPLNIGARANATSAPYIGSIAEMLVYATGLDSNSRRQVESYLHFKYAKQINLGPDTVVKYGFCPYNLNIGPTFSNILWSTGATSSSITVTKSGTYWVKAKDAFGYFTTDTIKITLPFSGLNYKDSLLCMGSYTLQPVFTGSSSPYSYLWSTGATTSSLTFASAGNYSVKITDTSGCVLLSDTSHISFNNFPATRLLGNDTTICKYASISVLPSVVPLATSFAWSSGATTPSYTVLTGGNIFVTATNNIGCKSIDTINVTLTGNAPTTSFVRDTVCAGEPFHFTSQSTPNGGEQITKTRWFFGNGDSSLTTSPTYTYPNTGTYNLTLTNFTQTGCQSSVTQQLNVPVPPNVDFISDTGCVNNPYNFQNLTSVASGDSVLSWNWNLSVANSTLFSPVASYSSTGLFPISLQVNTKKGCKEKLTRSLTVVNSAPIPFFFNLLQPVNNSMVMGNSISFQWGASQNAVRYQFQLSKDSLFRSFTVDTQLRTISYFIPTLPGATYYWRVIAKGYCIDSVISNVYVFVVPDPTTIPGIQAWYAADSSTLNGNLVSGLFDKTGRNNNAVQTTPAKQPNFIPNRLNGKPVVQFNGTATKFFGLRTTDSVDFTATNKITVFVVHQTKAFSNTITQTIYEHSDLLTNSDAFDYDVSGSAPDKEVVFTNGNAGFSGCQTNIARDTQFVISCQVIDKTLPGPSENTIYFNGKLVSTANFTNNNTDGFKKYPLNIGARGNATSAPYIGSIAEIIMYGAGMDSNRRKQVESYLHFKYAPPINLGPDFSVTYGVCDTVLNIGPYYRNVLWSTGDSSNSIRVKQGGTFWVTALDAFGFVTSDTININFPYHGANVGKLAVICLNDSLKLIQQIQPANAYSFLWQDGSTANFVYAKTPGAYYTQISDTNHCVIHSDTITINLDSFKLQSLIADTLICKGSDVRLTLNNYQSKNTLWSTGETEDTITILQGGVYSVIVTDANFCVAKDTALFTVHAQAPAVDFSVSNLCLGDTTALKDLSTASSPDKISFWDWRFSDGDSSSQQSVSHYFPALGRYNISLLVQTDSGCTGVKAKTIRIAPSPTADFSYPSVICAGTTSPFFDNSTILLTDTVSQWLWVFNNTDSFHVPNPTYSFPTKGSVPVKLYVTSKGGCSDSTGGVIDVFAPLVADFGASNVCLGDSTSFVDLTSSFSVIAWQWNFDDGSFFSTLQSPKHKYINSGDYAVKLTITNAIGCVDTVSKLVKVVHKPIAGFTNLFACVNTNYTPLDSSVSANEPVTRWNWSINGNSYNIKAPAYFFADTGIYPVKLKVTSQSGCIDSVNHTITVVPNPVALFTFAPLYGEAPLTVNFQNKSTNASSYLWNFDDGSGSSDINPSHIFENNGSYDISLTSISPYGCTDSFSRTLTVVHTELDLSVDMVQSVSTPQADGSSLVNITVRMSNQGTRVITNIKLYATLGSGGVISEDWSGILQSGNTMDYNFTAKFVIGVNTLSSYVCVEAVSVNNGETELRTDNNVQCATLTGGIQLIGPSPNPAYDNAFLGIILPKAGDVTLNLSDITGKLIIHDETLTLPGGRSDYALPVKEMRAGEYIMRVQHNDDIYIRRFVVK